MGNKSHNLRLLETAGFRVPPFIDVPPLLLSEKALADIVAGKFGKNTLFAVRSSASAEDSPEKSYAGQFYTDLGVLFKQLFTAYKKVSESLIGFDGSVIVQQFIPSAKSGVLFTNNGHGLLVVNSNFGICKTVVEGHSCDEWYLNSDNRLLRKSIATDKKPLEFIDSEIKYVGIKPEPSLGADELNELVVECRKIERHFSCAQDIEWCFFEGKLYILQSRPITRMLPSPNFIYFDSANIAESYSGIVLPLTQSFAVNIYKTVYKNLLVASGVSRKKLEKHNYIFNSMVAGYYGRMFYNMNSWYKMMNFLPGNKRNKHNLEKMLTMNLSENIDFEVHPTFGLKLSYPFIVIWKLIFFNRTIRRFENMTRSILSKARQKDFSKYSVDECLNYYKELENQLLSQFHIPVENDFLLMTYLGILRKKYPEQQLRDMLAFESVSSKQIEKITILRNKLYSIEGFANAIESENLIEFEKLLSANNEANSEIKAYFDCYSGRFANELKLESEDVENDYSLFIKLLKIYNCNKQQRETKHDLKKGFLFRKFYKYASKREDLRLLRSNCFSLVRKVFVRIGQVYAQQGKLKQEKDIFYCTIDELFAINTISNFSIEQTIEKRKLDYELFKEVNVPSFFALTENEMPHLSEEETTQTQILSGRVCSSGIIIGRIRVFHEFEIPDKIDFDIIVARNTDPGWSVLIGLSKGMIIENGGILSHAAIVSRELGIPTIIGVESATKKLITGQTVELNCSNGTIRIIE